MSVSADTLALLLEAGLSGEKLLAVVRSMEADVAPAAASARSPGAERQRRWRERNAGDVSCDVSRDVSGDASQRDAAPLPLPLSPQTPQTPTPSPPDMTTRARPAPKAVPLLREPFDRFWDTYPRKVAKPEAAKAYAKAIARIGGHDPPSVILAGLHAHLPGWSDTEPDLVPHPSTWLNQDRFNDRPTPRQPRLIHDRERSHPDRRTAALAERMQDIGAAADAAMR